MKSLRNTASVLAIATAMLASASISGQAFADQSSYHKFNIKAQSLISAINEFSAQTDIQILYSHDLIKTLSTNGLVGRYSSEEGLFVLFDEMGLTLKRTDANTYAVVNMDDSSPLLQNISMSVSAEEASYYESNLEAYEEDEAADDADELVMDVIIVTGTRSKNRSVAESLAPVDVLSASEIGNTTSDELVDSLAQLIPSFNVKREAMNDGAAFVRPARLRNLSPDQTLVMVNGKRRHRSAFIAGDSAAQAPDMAVIPSFGIKRVEVLRDGASAQYGSDALAGVVNIILDTEAGVSAFAQYGKYYAGDGAQFRVGIKSGWEIGDDGYMVISAEYTDAELTSRTGPHAKVALFRETYPDLVISDVVQRWGQPERQSLRLMFNSKVSLTDDMNFYSFGTFAAGHGESDFNFRSPITSGTFRDVTSIWPDYQLIDVFPIGFTPLFGQDDRDYSIVAGIDGNITDNLTYDFSGGYGKNDIEYFLNQTVNPSLGPDTPTRFKPGSLQQEEINVNLDFVYTLANDTFSDDVIIAFGAERRQETYIIIEGDDASTAAGPGKLLTNTRSNGFGGFSADQAGVFKQDNIGLYVDIELPVTDAWTIAGAARYEDYSIFGDTFNVKLSSRFEVSDNFSIRGTASTGFRAPTPGQLLSESIAFSFRTVEIDGVDTTIGETRGRFSPEGAIANVLISQGLDLSPVTSESATNYSFGFVYNADNGINLTVDIYQIDIDDRLSTSDRIPTSPEIIAGLEAAGIAGAAEFTSFAFFQNDFDTRTRGIDVILTYGMEAGDGNLNFTAAYNFNDTEVLSGSFLNSVVTKRRFEEGVPQHNAVLSATYIIGDWDFTSRARYYGSYTDYGDNNDPDDLFQTFGAITFIDLNVGYNINENVKLVIGAENILDTNPDKALHQADRGKVYSRNAPYDTDGGKYFARVNVNF